MIVLLALSNSVAKGVIEESIMNISNTNENNWHTTEPFIAQPFHWCCSSLVLLLIIKFKNSIKIIICLANIRTNSQELYKPKLNI